MLLYGSDKTASLLETAIEERPAAIQLFGREPDLIAEAIRRISGEHAGDGSIAAFDINFGCPAPKITGNGEGSALMLEPELIGRIVEAAAKASSVPLTVKIRKGFDADHINAVEVAKIAEDNGAAMITVHGRTREERYMGHADWSCTAAVKAAVKVPVIGNGDILSGADALRMFKQTGCDGLMVGRGALGNPWIFREIEAALLGEDYTPPTQKERVEVAIRHAHMTVAQKGPHGVIELRKHLVKYITGKREAGAMRAKLNLAKTLEEIEEILLDTIAAR